MSLRRRKTKENADYEKRIRKEESKWARKNKVRVSGGEDGRPLEFTDIDGKGFSPNVTQEVIVVGRKGSGTSFLTSSLFEEKEEKEEKNISERPVAPTGFAHVVEVIDQNGHRFLNKNYEKIVGEKPDTSQETSGFIDDVVHLEVEHEEVNDYAVNVEPVVDIYKNHISKNHYLQAAIYLILGIYLYLIGFKLLSCVSIFLFVALFVRKKVIASRILNGWFANNVSEARELIEYIYKNKDDKDFTDGLKRRELLYPEKDKKTVSTSVPVGGEVCT